MRKLSTQDRVRIVRCLTDGCSVRSTMRVTGASKDAILKLLADLGAVCAEFHNQKVRDIDAARVECDELWSFVGAKAATITRRPELQARSGIGDAWVWVGIDPVSKLVISFLIGHKTPESAHEFANDLAARLRYRVQISTDGYKPYFKAIPAAFAGDVDFGRVVKTYGNPQPDGRIGSSQLVCIGVKRQRVMGNPQREFISTSIVERQNLTVRTCQKRFARSTLGYSKKWDNLCFATALHYAYYNWCKPHHTLGGKTPAQAAKLADHAWSLDELVELLEAKERNMIGTDANRRGKYRSK